MSLKNVADAFWPHLDQPEIVDVFFQHASWLNRNTTLTGPTDAVAESYYKGHLGHAVAVARSVTTNPEILRKFAKDARVSVRQELLENPSTPRDTLVELTVWKFGRNDADIVACADRLTLSELVDALRRTAAEHGTNSVARLDLGNADAVEQCANEPGMAVALAKTGCIALSAQLARAAHGGKIPGVGMADVLDAHPEATETALHHVLQDRELLSKELAEIWSMWRKDPENRTYWHFGFSTTPFTAVEDGAADLLVDGDIAQLHTAIINGCDDLALRTKLASLRREEFQHVTDALTTRKNSSPETEQAFARRILEFSASDLGRFRTYAALEAFTHPLPDRLLVDLIRHGGKATLHHWLANGSSVNRLRPGLLTILGETPRWRPTTGESPVELAAEEHVTYLVEAAAGDPSLAPEVIALHDEYIGRNLHDRRVAAAVYPTLVEAFRGPEQRAAWETFVSLASDWSDSFTGIIGAVKGLLGITVEPETGPTTPSNEQLSLI
jgi:hypothetical protein